MEHKIKPERLEARVNPELKMRLQYAAALQGSSMTEFILRSAATAANDVIREYQILKLTREDSVAFVNALKNPPKANKELKSAFKDYKKKVSSQS